MVQILKEFGTRRLDQSVHEPNPRYTTVCKFILGNALPFKLHMWTIINILQFAFCSDKSLQLYPNTYGDTL